MRRLFFIVVWFFAGFGALAAAAEGSFRPLGEFVVQSRMKLTGDKFTATPIKPLKLTVSTDGEYVRIVTEGNEETAATFKIYRADGIGKQAKPGGPVEVLPGVQATADQGGVHQHLRMTRESLTLTSFPGVSDQTIVLTAVAVPPAATASSR